MPSDDLELISRYTAQRSESAFRVIVERHIDLVYSTALRTVNGDTHLAEDVTQEVFSHLASNASKLPESVVLAGWLHRDAWFRSLTALRSERRRKERERRAAEMQTGQGNADAGWEAIAPRLDEALNALADKDREVLVLRFLNGMDFRSVGVTLDITEDTAQKRVSRALTRLRATLGRRGIVLSTAALASVMGMNQAKAAPIHLIPTIVSKSVASAEACGSALKIALFGKLQAAVCCTILLSGTFFPALVQRRATSEIRRQQETISTQAREIVELHRTENVPDKTATSAIRTATPDASSELLTLRGEVGKLRLLYRELSEQATNRPTSREGVLAAMRQMYIERVTRLKEYFADHPDEAVPEMANLKDSDWLQSVMYDQHQIDPDGSHRRSSVRSHAQVNFAFSELDPALVAYGKANGGAFPSNIASLKPYFKNPVNDTLLQGWVPVSMSDLPPSVRIDEPQGLTQDAAIDPEHDQRVVVGLRHMRLGTGTNQWGQP